MNREVTGLKSLVSVFENKGVGHQRRLFVIIGDESKSGDVSSEV